MEGEAATDIAYVCPTCDQHIQVNAEMREAIIRNGCPVCSGAVAGDAFEP